jgi:hypothetical protein
MHIRENDPLGLLYDWIPRAAVLLVAAGVLTATAFVAFR